MKVYQYGVKWYKNIVHSGLRNISLNISVFTGTGTFARGKGISRYILHKVHTVLRKIWKTVHTNEVTSKQLGQKIKQNTNKKCFDVKLKKWDGIRKILLRRFRYKLAPSGKFLGKRFQKVTILSTMDPSRDINVPQYLARGLHRRWKDHLGL